MMKSKLRSKEEQDFITNLHAALKPLGFKKKRHTFSKADNGFYKIIHIQKSQFGDDFYINIGVHPIGLPQLITDQLQVKENISIFDCILRTRIEPIHMKQDQLLHNVSHETIDIPNYLSTSALYSSCNFLNCSSYFCIFTVSVFELRNGLLLPITIIFFPSIASFIYT